MTLNNYTNLEVIPILLRPIDSTGDILPVLSVSSCLKDSTAVAQLALYRLKLLKGEWWESPSRGCTIMETLKSSRLTEESAERFSADLTAYLRDTEGVTAVEDVSWKTDGRTLQWSCRLRTVFGETETISLSI